MSIDPRHSVQFNRSIILSCADGDQLPSDVLGVGQLRFNQHLNIFEGYHHNDGWIPLSRRIASSDDIGVIRIGRSLNINPETGVVEVNNPAISRLQQGIISISPYLNSGADYDNLGYAIRHIMGTQYGASLEHPLVFELGPGYHHLDSETVLPPYISISGTSETVLYLGRKLIGAGNIKFLNMTIEGILELSGNNVCLDNIRFKNSVVTCLKCLGLEIDNCKFMGGVEFNIVDSIFRLTHIRSSDIINIRDCLTLDNCIIGSFIGYLSIIDSYLKLYDTRFMVEPVIQVINRIEKKSAVLDSVCQAIEYDKATRYLTINCYLANSDNLGVGEILEYLVGLPVCLEMELEYNFGYVDIQLVGNLVEYNDSSLVVCMNKAPENGIELGKVMSKVMGKDSGIVLKSVGEYGAGVVLDRIK